MNEFLNACRNGLISEVKNKMPLFGQIDHLYLGLHEAAGCGKLEVFRYILRDRLEEFAPQFDLENGIIWPFQLAAKCGHIDILKYLAEEMPFEVKINVDLAVDENFVDHIKRKGLVDIAKYLENIPVIQEDVKQKIFDMKTQKAALKMVEEFFD